MKLKSGISAPGLMCCGLFSQSRMFAGVFSIMPAAKLFAAANVCQIRRDPQIRSSYSADSMTVDAG